MQRAIKAASIAAVLSLGLLPSLGFAQSLDSLNATDPYLQPQAVPSYSTDILGNTRSSRPDPGNEASTTQFGLGNSSQILQFGAGNNGSTSSFGVGNRANFAQYGFANRGSVVVAGEG
ncbi:MAG: hypothetical protein JXQ99_17465, partial [Hyphomicrobiaceae bacterium]